MKGIVLDTHDITDHLLAKEEDGGRWATDDEIIDVDDESADGEEAERVHAEEAGGEKEQEVEGEKKKEMEVVVNRRTPSLVYIYIFFFFLYKNTILFS